MCRKLVVIIRRISDIDPRKSFTSNIDWIHKNSRKEWVRWSGPHLNKWEFLSSNRHLWGHPCIFSVISSHWGQELLLGWKMSGALRACMLFLPKRKRKEESTLKSSYFAWNQLLHAIWLWLLFHEQTTLNLFCRKSFLLHVSHLPFFFLNQMPVWA